MKKTFTDEQIVHILRGFEASGSTIKEYCRQKVSASRLFTSGANALARWKSRKFGILSNCRRENVRLKRLLAERDLEIDVMKEVVAKKW